MIRTLREMTAIDHRLAILEPKKLDYTSTATKTELVNTLRIETSKETLNQFKALCKSKGFTMGEILHNLVLNYIKEKP